MALILLVLGSIYLGIATATEAAAFGVVGALVAGGRAGLAQLGELRAEPDGRVATSCMIALILAGAAFLTLAMGFTGLPRHLAEWIAALDLSPSELIAGAAPCSTSSSAASSTASPWSC